MKKLFLILTACLMTSMLFAQETTDETTMNPRVPGTFRVDAGGALTIEVGDNFVQDDELGFIAGIFNVLKAGAYVDGLYVINDFVSVGAELGFYAFTTEDSTAPALFDLPVLAVVEGNLFDVLRVKAHTGYTLSQHLVLNTDSNLQLVNKFDIGAKVFLGPIYVDYSKLFWADSKSSTKYGFGIELNVM